MENIEQNEERRIDSQNPKLQIVKTKNQIDYFMNSYTVYKKGETVVMEVIFTTESGNNSRFFELTKEEYDSDNFRAIANAIKKNPEQYSSRELF